MLSGHGIGDGQAERCDPRRGQPETRTVVVHLYPNIAATGFDAQRDLACRIRRSTGVLQQVENSPTEVDGVSFNEPVHRRHRQGPSSGQLHCLGGGLGEFMNGDARPRTFLILHDPPTELAHLLDLAPDLAQAPPRGLGNVGLALGRGDEGTDGSQGLTQVMGDGPR